MAEKSELLEVLEKNQVDGEYKGLVKGFLEKVELGGTIPYPLLEESQKVALSVKGDDPEGNASDGFLQNDVMILTSIPLGTILGDWFIDAFAHPVNGGFSMFFTHFDPETGEYVLNEGEKWVPGFTFVSQDEEVGFPVSFFEGDVRELTEVTYPDGHGWLAENVDNDGNFVLILTTEDSTTPVDLAL